MGIGISYTGHDGIQRRFDDIEKARSFLDSMPRPARRKDGDALRKAVAALKDQGGVASQKPAPKVLPGGSVVDSQDGLCLRGEEMSPLVEGVKVFASVNGSKGFKRMDEIDPPGSAAVCGPMFGCDSENEDASEAQPGEAVRIPFVSRTKMEKDDESGQIVLYEFIREMAFSPSGRMVGCTKERRRVVGSFAAGSAGGGGSKYGVNPLFSGGVLSALQFGTESQLDAGAPAQIVSTTTCPNAGGR